MQAALAALEGLATSAANNAADQRRASGIGDAGGASSGSASWAGLAGGAVGRAVDSTPFKITDGAIGVVGLGGLFGSRAALSGRYSNRYTQLAAWASRTDVAGWKRSVNPAAAFTHYKQSSALQHLSGSPVLRGLNRLDERGGKPLNAISRGFAIIGGGRSLVQAFSDAGTGDAIGAGTSAADAASIALKQSRNPVAYLGGVTLSVWSENVKEARNIDWDQGLPSPFGENWQKIWVPSLKETGDQFVGTLPKIFL